MRGFIGLDGGSTSSKAVLIDEQGEILCKAYMLSKGNPIADTQHLLAEIQGFVAGQGATLEVLGEAEGLRLLEKEASKLPAGQPGRSAGETAGRRGGASASTVSPSLRARGTRRERRRSPGC